MKKILALITLLTLGTAYAAEIYLPSLGKNASGTTVGGKNGLDVNVIAGAGTSGSSGSTWVNGDAGSASLAVRHDASGNLTGIDDGEYTPLQVDSSGNLKVSTSGGEAATAADNGSLPALTKVISGYDGSNVQVLKTDSSGRPDVTVNSSALPSGAATSAKQDTSNTSLASIDGKMAALGQTTMSGSMPVAIASNQSAIPASQSGTWNITNVSGTVSLPTGASTAAKQPALGTAGTASADVITVQGIASMTALKVDGSAVTQPISAASLPLPTGASTSALQTTGNTSLSSIDGKFGSLGQKAMTGSAPVVLASDQAAIPVTQSGTWNVTNISGTVSLPTGAATSANQSTEITSLSTIATNSAAPVTGSGSGAAATVSTVATLTAPANTRGFILMNLDTSTANVRWAVGRTAATNLGQQLQPGRDTGFVPIGANISIIAESGTQNIDVQWVSQ